MSGFAVATAQGGECEAFPDPCKTPAPPGPPVPMPYKNSGKLAQVNRGTCPKKVKVMNQPPLTTKSEIPMSMGDEQGSAGGLVSGTIKGPVKVKKGSMKVKAEGAPLAHQNSVTAHNGSNANAPMGVCSSVSQGKVKVKM